MDGARSPDELAAEAGCHAGALYRVLRALAAAGVVHEDDDRRFSLTAVGELLRSDVSGSLAPWAALVARPYLWRAWGELMHSVCTGENAFAHVHGVDVWEYRAEHPEEGAIFDRAMTAQTRRSNQAVIDAYDFGRFETIVDVGGGEGAVLAAILAEHPKLRGVLFDQPHVVEKAHDLLSAAGVSDRVRVESGSFFDGVPPGGDAYILRFIIHDWPDAECIQILRNIRAVLPTPGRVLVVENLVPSPNEGLAVKLLDLQMLVAPGGQERTIDEYARLLANADLGLVAVTPTASGFSVIEAAATGAGRP